MPSSEVLALLLADSRTPAGGYAHSGGLEAAVEAGLGAADVPAFMAARLETVAFVDAAFAAAAVAGAGATGAPGNGAAGAEPAAALLALDDELAARTPSAPLRAAARQLGRALLRLGRALWPHDGVLAAYAQASDWTPRPVTFGALAASAGLAPAAAARLSLYEDAAGVASAAVKLLALDAAATTAWVAALASRIEALAGRAAQATHVAPAMQAAQAAQADRLPATATPLLDLRSLDHDSSERRLFVT